MWGCHGVVLVPASCPICCHILAVLRVRDSPACQCHRHQAGGRFCVFPGAVRGWVVAGKGTEEFSVTLWSLSQSSRCPGAPQSLSIGLIPEPQPGHGTVLL